MNEAFWQALADRHHHAPPDDRMRWEVEEDVARYVGDGTAAFQYSLRFFQHPKDPATQIDREISRARSLGRAIEWIAYPRPDPSPWVDRLQDRGFLLKRRDRMFFSSSDRTFPSFSAIRVDEALSRSDLSEVSNVLFEVWNDRAETVIDLLSKELSRGSGKSRAFLVRREGRPVACAWTKYYGDVAYLFGGSTVPGFRGQGAYPALVAARAQRAQIDGIPFVVADCSPSSERVMRKLGFTDGGSVCKYELGL